MDLLTQVASGALNVPFRISELVEDYFRLPPFEQQEARVSVINQVRSELGDFSPNQKAAYQ